MIHESKLVLAAGLAFAEAFEKPELKGRMMCIVSGSVLYDLFSVVLYYQDFFGSTSPAAGGVEDSLRVGVYLAMLLLAAVKVRLCYEAVDTNHVGRLPERKAGAKPGRRQAARSSGPDPF